MQTNETNERTSLPASTNAESGVHDVNATCDDDKGTTPFNTCYQNSVNSKGAPISPCQGFRETYQENLEWTFEYLFQEMNHAFDVFLEDVDNVKLMVKLDMNHGKLTPGFREEHC